MTQSQIFLCVAAERLRQSDLLRKNPDWVDISSIHTSHTARLPVLLEEVGEVAKAMNDHDEGAMAIELIQVMAVCSAWLETRPRPCPPLPS